MDKIKVILNQALNFIISNSHFDFHSVWFQLLILIAVVVALSFLVNFFLIGSIFGSGYRVFVAPGVVLHEISHAFFCLVTGAKIKKISLFDKDGGSVEHEQSKLPFLGPLLISFAPFLAGTAAIFFFARWLGLKEIDLQSISLSYESIILFFKSILAQINFHSYQNWLILYLALSVAVTMTPSRQDIKNIALLLLAVVILFYGLIQFTDFHLPLAFIPVEKAVLLLNTVIILLILSLVLSMIVFAISKLMKR